MIDPQAQAEEEDVALFVGGQIHRGWLEVGCDLSIEYLANSFTLTVSDIWPDNGALVRRPMHPGEACKLVIGNEAVITGWIDRVEPSFSASEHQVSIAGRDRAGDLADCSAEVTEFHGQSLEDIIEALAKPFGVSVLSESGTGNDFKNFKDKKRRRQGRAKHGFHRAAVNTGDTVGEMIDRLCRQRGVLAWSDGLGNIIVGRVAAGQPVGRLERGQNLLSASASYSFEERFSSVTVKGGEEGHKDGKSDWSGEDGDAAEEADTKPVAHGQAVARDPEIKRHRPLIMIGETQGDGVSFAERAAWEVRVRRGRSRSITAEVQGWRNPSGGLWRSGQTVALADSWLAVDGLFIVASASLKKGSGGTLTSLRLMPPDAFDRLAEPEPEHEGGRKKKKVKENWDAE